MKKNRLRAVLLVSLALLLTAAVSIMGTLAYLSDRKEADNVLKFGNVEVSLKDSSTQNPAGVMQPGTQISRKPYVENVGTVDSFIRAEVVLSDASLGNQQNIKDFVTIDKNSTDWDWSTFDTDGFVYYNSRLLTEGETTPIFNAINLAVSDSGSNPLLEGANNSFKVIIKISAVQSDLEGENYADGDARTAFADMMP